MLRISLDTKAKVKIGEFSRNGKVRTRREIKGLDHDHNPKAVLVPLGILNTETNRTDIIFGNSSETSDFIVDGPTNTTGSAHLLRWYIELARRKLASFQKLQKT